MPVHRKVIEEFEKKGYKFQDPANPDHRLDLIAVTKGMELGRTNHDSFYRALAMFKETGGYTQKIIGAKRVKLGDKEYVILALDIVGTQWNGEPFVEHWPGYGKYELPVWKRVFNAARNRWEESDEAINSKAVYEIEWKGDKTAFEDIEGKKVKLVDMADGNTRWLVQSTHKLKVSREDWLNLSYDDIVAKYENNATQKALTDLTDAIKRAQALTGDK